MASIVLKSLSILLGIFFVFVGTLKITSYLSKDLHKDLRKEYVKYAKVFPFAELLNFKVPSKWYRRVVGSLEIICGFTMAIVPNRKIKNTSNVILLCLMLMAVYSHHRLDDKLERTAPALAFQNLNEARNLIKHRMSWHHGHCQTEELYIMLFFFFLR
ncbi:novel acetylcholine receptor chaperone isoform X1 [Cotesia glomerata]|uniref:novel acetylcholine receptor chaperone isoform X1 n=1 Tax=Cotesia glomerata TaxID=32391 RepID=UPI001D01F17D|nr:novel acetylcholine receptor chaperone isoform X1 [Cotesia glomerata]